MKSPTKITLREYTFIQNYSDLRSNHFGNAYSAAVAAGFTPSYARVITTRYPKGRLLELKRMSEDKDTVRLFELAREGKLNDGQPQQIWGNRLKYVLQKNRKALPSQMSFEEVKRELDSLLILDTDFSN